MGKAAAPTVRCAESRDVAAIGALAQRYWEFESIDGFDRQRVESLLHGLLEAPQRGACWIAETDGVVCGYLLAVLLFSLEHGGMMAEVDELYLQPEARSLGLGAQLVSRAEQDLAAAGVVRLQLQIGIGNDAARRFYQRLGFAPRSGYELLDKAVRRAE